MHEPKKHETLDLGKNRWIEHHYIDNAPGLFYWIMFTTM